MDAILAILGRLMHAYREPSFDSFLALRSRDLSFAESRRAGDLDRLRALCVQAGAPPEARATTWLATLEVFWNAYYRCAPVARFQPERTRLRLHAVPTTDLERDAWNESFEVFCRRGESGLTEHNLMLPHRRSIDELLADGGELTWFDVDLSFVSERGIQSRFIARFVRDEVNAEWFLQRSATVHGEGVGPDDLRLVS